MFSTVQGNEKNLTLNSFYEVKRETEIMILVPNAA